MHFSHNHIIVWNLDCQKAPVSHETCNNIKIGTHASQIPYASSVNASKHHTAWAVKFISHNVLQRNPAIARSQSSMMAEFQWADLSSKIHCWKMQFGFEPCLQKDFPLAVPAARQCQRQNSFNRTPLLCPSQVYWLPPSTQSGARLECSHCLFCSF